MQIQTLMLRFWGGGADKNRFHTRNCSFPSPALLAVNGKASGETYSALDAASAPHPWRFAIPMLTIGKATLPQPCVPRTSQLSLLLLCSASQQQPHGEEHCSHPDAGRRVVRGMRNLSSHLTQLQLEV